MKRFLKFSAVVFAVLITLIAIFVLSRLEDYNYIRKNEQSIPFWINLDILNYTEEEIAALYKINGFYSSQTYITDFSEIKDEETARIAAGKIFDEILRHRSPDDVEDIEIIYSEKQNAWFAEYSDNIVIIKAENAEILAVF